MNRNTKLNFRWARGTKKLEARLVLEGDNFAITESAERGADFPSLAPVARSRASCIIGRDPVALGDKYRALVIIRLEPVGPRKD